MTVIGQCDSCGVRYDAASTMDHCAEEGLCWEHCTDFVAHSSPAVYDEDERPMPADDDREYDRAVDDAVGEAADAGDIGNWRAYLRGGA